MDAGKRSIHEIFNGNKILEVPFFQRSYVWDETQWERFLSDMEHVSYTNKPHFLGSVILKQQLTNSQQSVGDKRTVIDGQQRLTTVTIFFKVLSLKLGNEHLANIFRLPMKNYEIALLHNHNDVVAYNSVLNLQEEIEIPDHDKISRAYTYFKENIDIAKLNFQNILTNIMFVGIDLAVDEDEQQIFDTINSLGVKLTTAELLKNFFFSRDDISLYHTHWLQVFETNTEVKDFWDTEIVAGRYRRQFIDLFFYSLLQLKIQDNSIGVSSEDKIEFSKVEGLFDSYKKFIQHYNIDKSDLIEEIKEYAQLFQAHFDPGVTERELSGSDYMDRINAIIFGLENSTLIPYVLFILKNVSDKDEKENILRFIESYIMRRMVCHASTKNYNQLFGERLILNNVKTKDDLKEYLGSQSDQINYFPTDAELKEGFLNSKLVNKQATGILYFLESKIRARTRHATALLGLNSYSLEHIMPKKWENNWDQVDDIDAKVARNRILLTLGNLTILPGSLNSSIRDSSWSIKKEGKSGRPGLMHYAAGLDTFSQYLNSNNWSEVDIKSRAEFLFDHAKEVWKEV